MNQDDPITQFFPDQESVDLYEVLSLNSDAKQESIKKAYRRLALAYHPDKHNTADDAVKAEASIKFQQIGFAYAVLSDETRKARYDKTGRTDEGFELAAGEDGWEAYFEAMFERVTRGKLDEMKKQYQGSAEEIDDLKAAYIKTQGSIAEMMTYIAHSTHDDEARFIVAVSGMIAKGDLPAFATWESSTKDEKARLVRETQGKKEAREAEKLAKELGVWDEFYGSGEAGPRKGKGKGKGNGKGKGKEKGEPAQDGGPEDEDDHSALQALILKKRQRNMDGFFDGLAAKYADTESDAKSRTKGKKRAREGEGTDSKKQRRTSQPMPEIDDEEFDALQKKLFGEKATVHTDSAAPRVQRGGRRAK